MQFSYKNNLLKIDNGDHYYTAEVKQEMFPEEIRDNYEEIIEQSFINYSDATYSVSHEFNNFDKDNNIISITFNFTQKPFTFKRLIEFKMIYHLKDYKDYTNERIEKLEASNIELKNMVEELKSKIDNLLLNKNDTEEEEDEEEEEEEEEEVVPVKGGKKVPTVVQMRGGKQVTAKK
jgi:hypothetical protein